MASPKFGVAFEDSSENDVVFGGDLNTPKVLVETVSDLSVNRVDTSSDTCDTFLSTASVRLSVSSENLAVTSSNSSKNNLAVRSSTNPDLPLSLSKSDTNLSKTADFNSTSFCLPPKTLGLSPITRTGNTLNLESICDLDSITMDTSNSVDDVSGHDSSPDTELSPTALDPDSSTAVLDQGLGTIIEENSDDQIPETALESQGVLMEDFSRMFAGLKSRKPEKYRGRSHLAGYRSAPQSPYRLELPSQGR